MTECLHQALCMAVWIMDGWKDVMGFAAHWVLTFLSKYFTQFHVWNTCLFSIVDEDKLTKYWHLCKVLLKRDSIEFFGHWVSPVWSGFLWHGTWFLTLLSGHLWPFFQLLKKNVFPQASILMMTCCQKYLQMEFGGHWIVTFLLLNFDHGR